MSNVDTDRKRVLELLQAHGWNALSFQVLEPGFEYWFDGEDACVGYVDTGRAWVVGGAPIAARERLQDVAAAFAGSAREAGRRAVFFGTETRFLEATGWPSLRIGDQPVWAPDDWSRTLERRRSLREQLRRARAKAVVVRRLDADELSPGHPSRDKVDLLIDRWLATRPMAPMGFLVQVHPYTFPSERHCFIAEMGERVVGVLAIVPVYSRRGWFFEDFLSDPDAPNGTVELLIDAGMRAAASSGVSYVTLGLVPLAGDVGRRLRVVRRWGRLLYDFDGLRGFKAKLGPRAWEPIHISYPPNGSSWRAVADSLAAFSRSGLFAFGLRTLLRGPAIAMRLLAIVLVPWTLLLALPSSRAWFPSEAVRWAWVAFDMAVGIALYRLSGRWNPWLANVLIAAISLDAILTAAQALLYDLPRHGTPWDVAVIAVAVLAPTVAVMLLWAGRSHRLRLV
ncbi:MAG TPA: DUF2156 domain-containing protein [Vicinamibacteria bacterium]